MKDRVKMVQKKAGVTQQEFANMLNVSKSTIEGYEYGRLNIPDRTVADICRVFNVNEDWLRTGTGEMFVPRTRNDEISDIFAKLYEAEPGDFQAELTQAIYRMTPEQIKALKAFVLDLADHLNNEN